MQRVMQNIKGLVMCESTQRLLNRFKIQWFDEKQQSNEQVFGSESEGFFEMKIASNIKQIFVIKENYVQTCINISPMHNSYIAKVKKSA